MQPIVKPMLHAPEDAYAGSKWKTEQGLYYPCKSGNHNPQLLG